MSKGLNIRIKKLDRSQGQSMIEMAVLLPLLLVLIIGAIEFGRLFFTQVVITNAAREGAYYLATHPSDYDSGTGNAPNTTIAAEMEASNSGIDNITVSVVRKNCCTIGLYSVEVTVETDVGNVPILGFFGGIFNFGMLHEGSFHLSEAVEMMVQ
jgi:Flp pilus assembly protein TadG